MPQLSHDLDDADRVTAVSADVAGERQGNGKAALGEGFPVTGVVFRHARGRRLVAHGGEKGTVRATENVEPEKLFEVRSSLAVYRLLRPVVNGAIYGGVDRG